MKAIVFRTSTWNKVFHWTGAISLIVGAILMYFFMLWLPYVNATMTGCPSVCDYDSDCKVEQCGTPKISASCDRDNRKCTMTSGGHTNFFSASSIFLLALLGLGWIGIAIYKTSLRLEADEQGMRYSHWLGNEKITPWDAFLGVTYHGVTTRLGRPATIYSITGDAGIFSYLVMGLPENTSTREIEMGSFLLLKVTSEQSEKLLALIKSQTNQVPEPEREW